jgi:hypothetical protein
VNVSSLTLTKADAKTIQKIKEGAHKAYPEQVYVDPAVVLGIFVTFLSGMFLIISVLFSGSSTPFLFELAVLGTILASSFHSDALHYDC